MEESVSSEPPSTSWPSTSWSPAGDNDEQDPVLADTDADTDADTATDTATATAVDESIDLDAIERDLTDVQTALERLNDGSYWTDEVSGDTLPDDVLASFPLTRSVAGSATT